MEKFITQKIFADTDPADEQELKLETGLNINTLKFILMDEAVIILFSHALAAKVERRLKIEEKESLTREEIVEYLLDTGIEMAKKIRDLNSTKS